MLAAGAAAAVSVLAPSAASAIPTPQQACASPGLTLSGGTGPYHSMGVSVTINDGTSSRNIVAFTSLDGNVSPNAEMRLSWSVDGGAVSDYTFGPGEHRRKPAVRRDQDRHGRDSPRPRHAHADAGGPPQR
jgi:hypothetical protein